MNLKNRAQLMLAQIQSLTEESRAIYDEIFGNAVASNDAEDVFQTLDRAEYSAKCLVESLP